jgi:hypothetical protein
MLYSKGRMANKRVIIPRQATGYLISSAAVIRVKRRFWPFLCEHSLYAEQSGLKREEHARSFLYRI